VNKLIFVPTLISYDLFHGPDVYYSDFEIWEFTKRVIDTVQEYNNVWLDIKILPDITFEFNLKKYLNKKKVNNVNLIYGPAFPRIMGRYDLLVFHYLSTPVVESHLVRKRKLLYHDAALLKVADVFMQYINPEELEAFFSKEEKERFFNRLEWYCRQDKIEEVKTLNKRMIDMFVNPYGGAGFAEFIKNIYSAPRC